jgi:transposase-like protein
VTKSKSKRSSDESAIDVNKPLFEQLVPSVDIEKAFGIEFGRYRNQNVYCPFCENAERSKSPSCSVSIDGIFKCKSCGRSGFATAFYAQLKRVPLQQAKESLKMSEEKAERWLKNHPTPRVIPVTEAMIKKCHEHLLRSTFDMTYLTGHKRGLELDTLIEYEIGADEWRITIPVRTRNREIWGLRRYHAAKTPKMVSHPGGQGGPYLYPAINLDKYRDSDQPFIVLCEGEWDCLIAIQNGFDAITVTSGVKTWEESFTMELLTIGKPIVIIYDVHDKKDETGETDLGQRVAQERVKLLRESGLTVYVVALPLPKSYIGGDITDWFTKAGRNKEDLRSLIMNTINSKGNSNGEARKEAKGNTNNAKRVSRVSANPEKTNTKATKGVKGSDSEAKGTKETKKKTKVINDPPVVSAEKSDDAPFVTLHEASQAKYLYKAMRLRCLVAGRVGAPYLLPTKIEVTVYDEDDEPRTFTKHIDPWDSRILSLIKCSSSAQQKNLRSVVGVDSTQKVTFKVLESLNVEEIFLIPTIDHETDQGPYVLRECYYVGYGLQTNQVYDFEGYTLPHPKSQAATHILTSAKPAATDLQNFSLTDDQYEQLKKTFQTKDLFGKLEEIADEFADHVTHVRGRPDLHIAVDLVFHSPLSFEFDGSKVPKGWLEALVVGDTRTGKGFVAENLIKHYGVGEVVSAEFCTMAGLIGGINRVGDQNILCWGKIPLANERLIVIDEASNLSYQDIGQLSRVRSEGVIEITKILTEKTSAKTRLLWLSNPRPPIQGKPKVMKDFPFGILAVPELIGNSEDIARFDYVLTVATGEVNSKLINRKMDDENLGEAKYTSELCRKLIVWIWSRKSHHIVFDEGVIEYTLEAAQDLGKQFSHTVCLIQAEDVRFKLARIAAAAAGRTFSTDDGEHLIVKKEHVAFAYNFLHHIYSKASCGYAQLSLAERERSTLRDPQAVLICLQQVGDLLSDLVSGLLEQQQISARDLCDYAGVDIYQARSIISELVRLRAITKDNHFYVKKPSFKIFLQNLKQKIQTDPTHITVDDEEQDQLDSLPGDADADA